MNALIAPLLLLAGLLSGCVDTLFESQPAETVSSCDRRFEGRWRVLPADSKNQDDELFLIVDPQCKHWHFLEDGKEDEKLARTTHIAFASVAGKALLTVKVDPDAKDAGAADARWRDGYYYFRYEFADKSIHLRGVDDHRVAHLIIDGDIQGRTERVSREPADRRGGSSSELHNFVAGKPDEMARVVQLDGVFGAADAYVLKPATRAEISRSAKKPAKP